MGDSLSDLLASLQLRQPQESQALTNLLQAETAQQNVRQPQQQQSYSQLPGPHPNMLPQGMINSKNMPPYLPSGLDLGRPGPNYPQHMPHSGIPQQGPLHPGLQGMNYNPAAMQQQHHPLGAPGGPPLPPHFLNGSMQGGPSPPPPPGMMHLPPPLQGYPMSNHHLQQKQFQIQNQNQQQHGLLPPPLYHRHPPPMMHSPSPPQHPRPAPIAIASAPRQPKADLSKLDVALNRIAQQLLPTPEELAQLNSAFESVKAILNKRWPEANVILFGSVANGLSVRSMNDIDVCLELPGVGSDQAAKREVAVEIGEILDKAGMLEVLALPKARVPVVKFVVPATKTKVDITVNNTLACVNTKMLSDYCAIDERLRLLVAVVKHWAKRRAVNDPYRGTLSSYCYVLMCIHLLQSRSPPVLPVLQQLPHTFQKQVDTWECSYCDATQVLSGFGQGNQESLAALVWAFFDYWAWKHDYANGVVSIRTGGVLSKDSKGWTKKIGTERHLLSVEDPFELSHDLGRTVDRDTRSVMRKEFMRAASILRDSEDPLPELFEIYTNQ